MSNQELIQTRFTPSKFDAARSEYIGEGKLLTARYKNVGRTWRAELQWKKGYERSTTSITAYDEASLKSQLLAVDRTLRFLGKVNTSPVVPTQTLADKTDEMLEALRTDPATSDKAYISACQLYKQKPKPRNAPAEVRTQNAGRELSSADAELLEEMRVTAAVSDKAYRNACAKLGVPPRPRPTRAAVQAAQTAVPFFEQDQAWQAFATAHGELFVAPFAVQNAHIIQQWMKDENRQSDSAALEQAYRECSAANYFRDARTLSRDFNGSLRIVRPYSHAELVAARRQQTVEAATTPPAYLSDLERDCWQAVRQAHPSLSPRSAAFQTCCKDTLLKWSCEYCLEQDPSLGAANKCGELRAAIDRVITQWVRIKNPNLGAGNKTIKDTRIWLG
jgi:hypothetical protein